MKLTPALIIVQLNLTGFAMLTQQDGQLVLTLVFAAVTSLVRVLFMA